MNLFLVKVQQIQLTKRKTGFVFLFFTYALRTMCTTYYVPYMCYVVKINPCYSNYVKMITILFKLATLNL